MNAPVNQALQFQQQNMAARQMVLGHAVERFQQIWKWSGTDFRDTTVNIPLRNVGLVKRLLVSVEFTLAQAAAETLTRTAWGPANILKQAVFQDLSNQTRINTTGWHLHAVATARRQRAYGAAFTHDSPVSYGNALGSMVAPSSVTTATSVKMLFEIPFAYGDQDLRGAIYGAVVNATMNLQLSFGKFVAATGTNETQAAYQSDTADLGAVTASTIKVYQHYLDQLPPAKGGGFVVPIGDISTAYILNNTAQGSIVVNENNPVPYTNHRQILSTTLIYDQNGTLNAGTDIESFALEVANFINFWEYPPLIASHIMRNILGNDAPIGSYYFDHRSRPIDTIQYGNTQLLIRPSSAASGSQFLLGFEQMAKMASAVRSGSLPAG